MFNQHRVDVVSEQFIIGAETTDIVVSAQQQVSCLNTFVDDLLRTGSFDADIRDVFVHLRAISDELAKYQIEAHSRYKDFARYKGNM